MLVNLREQYIAPHKHKRLRSLPLILLSLLTIIIFLGWPLDLTPVRSPPASTIDLHSLAYRTPSAQFIDLQRNRNLSEQQYDPYSQRQARYANAGQGRRYSCPGPSGLDVQKDPEAMLTAHVMRPEGKIGYRPFERPLADFIGRR